ncbi:MAG: AarF/UbiB family protein [Bdellovibrionales bacterium]
MNLPKQLFKTFKIIKTIKSSKVAVGDEGRENALAHISNLLSSEAGIFSKLGQQLNTSKLYTEIDEKKFHFSQKTDKEWIKNRFFEEFGEQFSDHFTFLKEHQVTASLSSVVIVRELSSGKNWALKLGRKNIRAELNSQLKILNLIPRMGPIKKWGIDLEAYKKLIQELLDKELNYLHEIDFLIEVGVLFSNHQYISIPKVHSKYQSKNIYLQEYISGKELHEIDLKKLESLEKISISNLFLEFYSDCFSKLGALQTDGNWGNFKLFKKEKQWCLVPLDFGAFHKFEDDFCLSVLKLYLAIKKGSDIDPFPYLVRMGFDTKKLNHIGDKLPKLLIYLMEFFTKNYPQKLESWEVNKNIDMLLGESKWWFRSSGQREYFLFMKSISGLLNILRALDVPITYASKIEKSFSHRAMDIIQFNLVSEKDRRYSFQSLAKSLKVKVAENHKQKISVELPIRAILDLEDYLEPEIQDKLAERGLSLEEIRKEFLNSSGLPQLLFELNENQKSYLVEAV